MYTLIFFWVNFLHSLIMRLNISSISLYNRHLLFCCVLSIFALMQVVLMTLFYIISRNGVWLFLCFSKQRKLVVFRCSLYDSKSSQVPWTYLSILADLSNATVWMVSIFPMISCSSVFSRSSFGFIATIMFRRFFYLSRKIRIFFCFFVLSYFLSVVSRNRKVHM